MTVTFSLRNPGAEQFVNAAVLSSLLFLSLALISSLVMSSMSISGLSLEILISLGAEEGSLALASSCCASCSVYRASLSCFLLIILMVSSEISHADRLIPCVPIPSCLSWLPMSAIASSSCPLHPIGWPSRSVYQQHYAWKCMPSSSQGKCSVERPYLHV